MQYLFKIETAELISRHEEIMSEDLLAQYSALVRRRLRREPLQYITRRTEFWSLEFYVDQRVLIPRPESEHILEAVLADHEDKKKPYAVADIGAGSGCIGIALAVELGRAKVFGVDVDPGALEVATINASRHNVSNRVTFYRGNLLTPLRHLSSPKGFNIIVSNPPYISEMEAQELEPEVIKAEPYGALISGPTGLEVYEKLIPQLAPMLRKEGRFYLEIGMGQESEVRRLIGAGEGLAYQRTVPDLAGIPRIIVGTRQD
jgi:release factor glutamine methyltransferase